MSIGKKKLIIFTIIPAIASVALVSVALGTDYWVISSPKVKSSSTNNLTDTKENYIHFGLFKGLKTLNFGFGVRKGALRVACVPAELVCAWSFDEDDKQGEKLIDDLIERRKNVTGELYEVGLFSYGLWMSVIVMAALGMALGLISVNFAIYNALGKPIETITGPLGLYLWNGLAFFFTILAMILYLVLFFTMYKKNFLNSERDLEKFTVEETTSLGFSFFFVVIATVLYFINIIVLFLSGYKLRCSFGSEAEKVVDNGLILF